MTDRMRSNREQLDMSPRVRRWLSPSLFSLERTLVPRLKERARGDVLDAGCGAMPYREVVGSRAASYDGLDLAPRSAHIKYSCSVTDMAPVPDQAYDTLLCSEVLEHVSHAPAAVAEFARVLRPGGRLIVSVPFLGRLHEEPNDFQRYTEHGLRLLLTDGGFDVDEVAVTGSVMSFLGHQVSSALVLPTWDVPVLGRAIFLLNALFVVLPSLAIDAVLRPLQRKLPLGYVAVATRRSERSS